MFVVVVVVLLGNMLQKDLLKKQMRKPIELHLLVEQMLTWLMLRLSSFLIPVFVKTKLLD